MPQDRAPHRLERPDRALRGRVRLRARARTRRSARPAARVPSEDRGPEGRDSRGAASAPASRRFEVAATMPPALDGLTRLARNLWWTWDPEATELFREIFPRKSGRSPAQRGQLPPRRVPEDLAARAARPSARRPGRARARPLRRVHGGQGRAARARRRARAHRAEAGQYFCAEFRPARIAAHLQRRTRHPRGRPPEVGERPEACPLVAVGLSTAWAT